jgi:hypothetical protein
MNLRGATIGRRITNSPPNGVETQKGGGLDSAGAPPGGAGALHLLPPKLPGGELVSMRRKKSEMVFTRQNEKEAIRLHDVRPAHDRGNKIAHNRGTKGTNIIDTAFL